MDIVVNVLPALSQAAVMGDVDRCRELLANGADVLGVPVGGTLVALHYAAAGGYTDVCELLVDSGTPVDIRDSDFEKTSLMLAAQNGHLEVVQLLVGHGADLSATHGVGRGCQLFADLWSNVDKYVILFA